MPDYKLRITPDSIPALKEALETALTLKEAKMPVPPSLIKNLQSLVTRTTRAAKNHDIYYSPLSKSYDIQLADKAEYEAAIWAQQYADSTLGPGEASFGPTKMI